MRKMATIRTIDKVVLHCQNECRDLKESLFERCMKYLKGE